MSLEFEDVAGKNANHYKDTDPMLWDRVVDVLEAISAGDAWVRQRQAFDFAWAVTITVPGRDDEYVLVWSLVTDGDAVAIHHLGPLPRAK